MKKLAVFAICALLLVSFCACGLGGGNQGEKEKLTYTGESVQASLDGMRDGGGYFIRMEITSYDSEGQTEVSSVAAGANGDIYHFIHEGGDEYIYDLSKDTEYVLYSKYEGEQKWYKNVYVYDEYMTRETAESMVQIASFSTMTFLTFYSTYEGEDFYNMGTAAVAGKTCAKYKYSFEFFTLKYETTYYIEKSTGLCLKYEVSASALGQGSVSVTFECKEYRTSYNIAIPTNLYE